MAVAREWFVWSNANGVEEGTRVRHTDGREGVVEHIWYGIEESLRVRLDDGREVTWYPAEGLDDVAVV